MTSKFLTTGWLVSNASAATASSYAHRVITEVVTLRPQAISDMQLLLDYAHSDTIDYYNKLYAPMHPMGDSAGNLLNGYPAALPHKTLFGYFGEVFGAIVAENFGTQSVSDWVVPVFLFRTHDAAIYSLAAINQGEAGTDIPGRQGEDCVAFQLSPEGKIKSVLFCECKCLSENSNATIALAHKKISDKLLIPACIGKIMEILRGKTDPTSQLWYNAIYEFIDDVKNKGGSGNYSRHDLITYICKPPTN